MNSTRNKCLTLSFSLGHARNNSKIWIWCSFHRKYTRPTPHPQISGMSWPFKFTMIRWFPWHGFGVVRNKEPRQQSFGLANTWTNTKLTSSKYQGRPRQGPAFCSSVYFFPVTKFGNPWHSVVENAAGTRRVTGYFWRNLNGLLFFVRACPKTEKSWEEQ